MNKRVRGQLEICKQRIVSRLRPRRKHRRRWRGPEFAATNIHYEMSDRTRAITCGGIGAVHLLTKRLGLAAAIDERLGLFKVHRPYHESDHVLNIAYNHLAGGTRLEHLELLRNDAVYLDAIGAGRIPDPTTAGDFCRRFDGEQINVLQDVFNEARVKVWQEQPPKFLDEAILDADGTMVETTGECGCGATQRSHRRSISTVGTMLVRRSSSAFRPVIPTAKSLKNCRQGLGRRWSGLARRPLGQAGRGVKT